MITLTAKITLADGTTYDVNKRNMLSFDSEIIDRSDIVMANFGIISNSGNLSFIDYDGRILNFAKSLKLNSKAKINIDLTNTISKATTQIGDFFAGKWNYDNNSANVSVSLVDGLQKMQDINVIPLVFNPQTKNADYQMAYKLYEYLRAQTVNNGFDMVSISSAEFDSATKSHLQSMSVQYPYIPEMSLWRAWQQFCEAFQVHIFKAKNGKIICYYGKGD